MLNITQISETPLRVYPKAPVRDKSKTEVWKRFHSKTGMPKKLES